MLFYIYIYTLLIRKFPGKDCVEEQWNITGVQAFNDSIVKSSAHNIKIYDVKSFNLVDSLDSWAQHMAYIFKDWDLFFRTIEILAYLFGYIVPFFTVDLRKREFDILMDIPFVRRAIQILLLFKNIRSKSDDEPSNELWRPIEEKRAHNSWICISKIHKRNYLIKSMKYFPIWWHRWWMGNFRTENLNISASSLLFVSEIWALSLDEKWRREVNLTSIILAFSGLKV